jgi:Zn-finger nucleic acid-binding protein
MDSPVKPKCPRCSEPLVEGHFSEPQAEFDSYLCLSCHGRFLSEEQLHMVEETVEPRLVEWRHLPSSKEQSVPLLCPLCTKAPVMEKYEHHRDHQVVLDRCPECRGIWLDHGELRAIREESLPVFLAGTVRYFWNLLK